MTDDSEAAVEKAPHRWPRWVSATLVTILAGGVTMTATAAILAFNGARDLANKETTARLRVIGDAIDRQVSRYAEALFGLRASFAQSPSLSRADFHALIDINALTRRNPGAQAISFARFVPASEQDSFQQSVRKAIPQFQIHPASKDPSLYVADYIEPPVGNEAALGFDLGTDPTRRTAVEFARDSAEPAATAPIHLIQGTDGPGFLLLLAAYDTSPAPVTTPARERHFLGALTAVFDAQQMLAQALEARPDLQIAIYDAGATVDSPTQRPQAAQWLVGRAPTDGASFLDIDVATRRWRLIAENPVKASIVAPAAIGTSGLALTVLVVGLVAAMGSSRARAIRLADQMTVTIRASQAELHRANDQLREADRLKDRFLGSVSHELRTPLTVIASISDLLSQRDDQLDDSLRQDLLKRLSGNVSHLRMLIDELLDFSSLEAIDQLPPLVPIDVLALARATVDDLHSLLSEHEIIVPQGSVPPAIGNPQDVHRVLNNLLVNAAKYSPTGGAITISVEPSGSDVVLTVADQGPGVPQEEKERIFERFYRGTSDAVLNQPGTGIGLAVVRDLCQRMGGSITVSDAPGGGACFAVRLPAEGISGDPAAT